MAQVIEFSSKMNHTLSQQLLKLMGVISKEEEKVAMGMDNPNDRVTTKGKAFTRRNLFMKKGHSN